MRYTPGILRIGLLCCAAALVAAAGCRGTSPELGGDPSVGVAAVLVRARLVTPTGETQSGRAWLNLESEAERYRLACPPDRTALYAVEPGTYRLSPTRGVLGVSQAHLRVVINGRGYKAQFPRDILRREALRALPGRVTAVGVLEARLESLPDRPGMSLSLRLDDSVAARRALVQDVIDNMLSADMDAESRHTAVTWTRALDQALVQLQGMRDQRPAYKPGQ